MVLATSIFTGLGAVSPLLDEENPFATKKAKAATLEELQYKVSLAPSKFGAANANGFANMVNGKETSDGGFIAVGSSSANNLGYTNKGGLDAFIIKYSADGKVEWVNNFGGNSSDVFNDVVETKDGGFVAVGSTNSIDSGYTGSFSNASVIIKYDKNGNKQWIKNYPGEHFHSFLTIKETADGGLIAGGSMSVNISYIDAFAIKMDANGNEQWRRVVGGNTFDEFDNIKQLPDGSYIMVGSSSSTNLGFAVREGGRAGYVVKVASNGSVQWTRGYASNDQNDFTRFQSADYSSDGGLIVVGETGEINRTNAYIAKYNASGTVLWSKRIPNTSYFSGVKVLPGNIIRAVGSINNNTHGYIDFDLNGNVKVARTALISHSVGLGKMWVSDDGGISSAGQVYRSDLDKLVQVGLADSSIQPGGISVMKHVIDEEKPTISLTYSETASTNKDVKVGVTISDSSGLLTKVWKKGPLPDVLKTNPDGWFTDYYYQDGAVKITNNEIVITENGTYSVYAKDAAGNNRFQEFTISNIDKEAPAKATFTPSTTDPTNQDVSVTISYAEDAAMTQYKIGASGEWKAYTAPLMLSKNETIFARSQDAAGNWSEESNIVIENIDKEPPAKPIMKSDNVGPTNSGVYVSIEYPSDAVIKQIRISGGPWSNYRPPFIPILDNRTLEARAIDAAGNISEIAFYEVTNIDKEKPVITLTPSRIDPVNVEIDVEVDVVDQNAIISKKWAKGEQPESYFETAGTDIAGESFIVGENGTYTVYAKDAAGNVSIKTISISNIDMEAPEIKMTPSKLDPVNTEILVDIEVSDNVAVTETKWAAGNQDTAFFKENGTILEGNRFVVSQNDTYTVYARDTAGNESVRTVTISNIDTVAPEITLTPSRLDPVNTVIDVDVEVSDENVIVAQKWAKGSQTAEYFHTQGTDIQEGKFIVEENGIYTAYAKDSAGNETIETIIISNIDMEAPVITLTPSKLDATNTAIDVDVEVTDKNTIVAKKWAKGSQNETYFETGGEDIQGDSFVVNENGTYTVFARDSAGNVSLETIEVSNIDMEAPVIKATPSKVDPVNTEIDVDVEVTENVSVAEVKWAAGNRAAAFFKDGGTILEGESFVVSENGTYTIYARDTAGNESVHTVTINNIDMVAPEITLTPSRIDPVNTEIDVDVDVSDENVIVTQKWAMGSQASEYFHTQGTDIQNGKFIVGENGIFTVYAKDSAGNETVKTITISNIDMEAPVITLTPSTVDPINTEIHVNVKVTDNNEVVEKKWAAGNQNAEHFRNAGNVLLEDKFMVSENGTYTVYAKDSAGNETIETILISNIDMEPPAAPELTVSTEDPTNQDVKVTINYAVDVTVKEYKVGNGNWEAYTGPVAVSANETIYARGRDAAGNWSEEASIAISNIDVDKPVITISGITNGTTYVNEAQPIISVEDKNKVETTLLLNGEAYDGSLIKESGSYLLTVTAVDAAGNKSIETIGFYVNHSPEIIGSIPDMKMKKFDKNTIDLGEVFSDEEDELTYKISSSNEEAISVSVKDGKLHIEALKQGAAIITVIANDGHSDSETISFTVENESVAPVISLVNDQTWVVGDGEKVTIEGIVVDPDKEDVVIKAIVNGVEKTITVTTTGGEDKWSIEFSGSDLGTGVHSLQVVAEDPFEASGTADSTKYIIKVPGNLADYESILSDYESDLKKDRQDFSSEEHTLLLDAFQAIESLKETNNPEAWEKVKPVIDKLADGKVKTRFYQSISVNANDYLIGNFDSATKSDYDTAGYSKVQEQLVPEYNQKNQEYLTEKGSLEQADIQLIIDIVNAVDKAKSSHKVEDWAAAKAEIEKLTDGSLKDAYLETVKDGFVKAIEVNPSELDSDLLDKELGIPSNSERTVDYQVYLQDELAKDPVLTKERLEKIVQTVDSIYELEQAFKKQPTQENLSSYESAVEKLTDGMYQKKNKDTLPGKNLDMLVNDPAAMTEQALNTIGITHESAHIPLYQEFLSGYLKDVAKEEITKEILQKIVDVVDALEVLKGDPSDENIQQLLDLLKGLDPSASIIKEVLQEASGSIIDTINQDFSKVTEKQLENIGIENLETSRLSDYQDALENYAGQKQPGGLTKEDIQKVIDAVNGVEDAKANPSEESLRAGYEEVNQLEDGPLKEQLLKELEDIAVEYISKNPGAITQDLLNFADLVTQPDLIDSYKEYLQDVLPELTNTVTKEKLQELIQVVDAVWAAYQDAINNPSREAVISFEELANQLEEGAFKDRMVGLIDDVALVYLKASPLTQQADDYARMGIEVDEGLISSYNSHMEKYLKDLGAEQFSFEQVSQVITVTDKVAAALADSKTSNVQQALAEVRKLENGSLKNTLTAALNGQVIEDINLNPATITIEDLENLGIVNLNPDFEELYQEALTKLKEDLGGTLTFEDIQKAVDAVNAAEKALDTGKNEDILAAFDVIHTLPDGSLKDALFEKLKEEVARVVIEDPESITAEHLEKGGFESVDSSLEEEYKEALIGYQQPLTKEAVQQVIDVVNQVKKTQLDLTQDDVNKLGKMVDQLAVSDTKERLERVKVALKALLDAEQYMNTENVRNAFDKVALVESREQEYLLKMANGLSHVLAALVNPSDDSIAAAQGELVKLDDGGLRERMQSRVGGAYLEHVITSPGSSSHQDWINAGFENLQEDAFPIYKGVVDAISNEVGQLTKEQIQDIINAINAIEKAKKERTNKSIQEARDAISKVVNSEVKTKWQKEMDALWQSIQPKPEPELPPAPVKQPPVINPETLPKPSDKVMVVSNEHAAVVMTIPTIEVAETDSLKVKIKVSANDSLEGSKLYLYATPRTVTGGRTAAVSGVNTFTNYFANQKALVELDFGKLEKGTIEVDRELVFNENGEYLLQGVFMANGTNLETNAVKVSVFKELAIPNTVLPNPHGLPVASLKLKQDVSLYKKDKDGNFYKVSIAKAGTHHLVYDTERGYYKLADGFYALPSSAVSVHIGKGEIRKDEVNVYDKNGRFIRTLKKGQQYKVYSYDNNRYSIGGGEYIEIQDGVTFVFGWISVKEPITLYKPDGTAARTLKAGEKYRVYGADKDNLHVGGGYTIKRANIKYDFLKN